MNRRDNDQPERFSWRRLNAKRPPPVKLAVDHPRDMCVRCKSKAAVIWTVADAFGNEDPVCVGCYREAEAAKTV